MMQIDSIQHRAGPGAKGRRKGQLQGRGGMWLHSARHVAMGAGRPRAGAQQQDGSLLWPHHCQKSLQGPLGSKGTMGKEEKKKNLKNYKLSQLRSLILPALSLPFLGWIRNPARAPRDASSSLSPSCYIIPLGLFCIHVGVTSPSAQTQP